jgi:hypothetical protein
MKVRELMNPCHSSPSGSDYKTHNDHREQSMDMGRAGSESLMKKNKGRGPCQEADWPSTSKCQV